MFFIKEKKAVVNPQTGQSEYSYAVEDTKDSVVEWYDSNTLLGIIKNLNIKIKGYWDINGVEYLEPVVNKGTDWLYTGEVELYSTPKIYARFINSDKDSVRSKAGELFTIEDGKVKKTPISVYKVVPKGGKYCFDYSRADFAAMGSIMVDNFTGRADLRFSKDLFAHFPAFLTQIQESGFFGSEILKNRKYICMTRAELIAYIASGEHMRKPIYYQGETDGVLYKGNIYSLRWDSIWVYLTDMDWFFKYHSVQNCFTGHTPVVTLEDFYEEKNEFLQSLVDTFLASSSQLRTTYTAVDTHLGKSCDFLPLGITVTANQISVRGIENGIKTKTYPIESLYEYIVEVNSNPFMYASGEYLTIKTLSGVHRFNMTLVYELWGRTTGGNKKEAAQRKLLGLGDIDVWRNGELHSILPSNRGEIVIPKNCTRIVEGALKIDETAKKLVIGSNVKKVAKNAVNYHTSFANAIRKLEYTFNDTDYSVVCQITAACASAATYDMANTYTVTNTKQAVSALLSLLVMADCARFDWSSEDVQGRISLPTLRGIADFDEDVALQFLVAAVKYVFADFKCFRLADKYIEKTPYSRGVLNTADEVDEYHRVFRNASAWQDIHSRFLVFKKFYTKLCFEEKLSYSDRIYWRSYINSATKQFNTIVKKVDLRWGISEYGYAPDINCGLLSN